jgi:hypothetical protein
MSKRKKKKKKKRKKKKTSSSFIFYYHDGYLKFYETREEEKQKWLRSMGRPKTK